MGGSDKGDNMKGQSVKNKDCVSEATISKLLDDFNCASLLTSARPTAGKGHASSIKEESHTNYEKVVSSLKHLHLKKPVHQRTRLKRKKTLERTAKTALADKYNLSVAAINAQRPVVWPGKLNCVSQKTESDIIQPSRLSIPVKNDQPLCTSFLTTSVHTTSSSSQEKTRIAASLHKQDLSLFRGINEKDKNTQISFSKLCKRNYLKNSNEGTASSESAFSSNPSAISTSVKHQSYRSPPLSDKHQGNFSFSVDQNQSCSRVAAGNSAASAVTVPLKPSTSSINQSSITPSVTGSAAIERSCSEEMRMEESNVNELASYFEDLLHIPRKMSVMAEMMYA